MENSFPSMFIRLRQSPVSPSFIEHSFGHIRHFTPRGVGDQNMASFMNRSGLMVHLELRRGDGRENNPDGCIARIVPPAPSKLVLMNVRFFISRKL